MKEWSLVEMLKAQAADIREVCAYFNQRLLPEAVGRVNSEVWRSRLIKLARNLEPLPTAKRQLTSYRTRMGTVLEYAVSTAIQEALATSYDNELLLTFAVAHEYPDFYLRDRNLRVKLRIEMKSVDADSDEQAARFDVPTARIEPQRDLCFFIAWEWTALPLAGVEGEHPYIFAYLAAISSEIAAERDRRLLEIGGRIDGEHVMVPSTKSPGEMVSDPGNYGKLWRIISSARHGAEDQSEQVRRFEEFLRVVDQRTVARGARKRTRFRGQSQR